MPNNDGVNYNATGDIMKGDRGQQYDPPSVALHLSIERLSAAEQKPLLTEGAVVEEFDPTRPCVFNYMVPSISNPVGAYLIERVGAPVAIYCVQHRRSKDGKKEIYGLCEKGLLKSCAFIHEE